MVYDGNLCRRAQIHSINLFQGQVNCYYVGPRDIHILFNYSLHAVRRLSKGNFHSYAPASFGRKSLANFYAVNLVRLTYS
ncbi:hypothetical protein C5167_006325 [Papaver somniferum]|uniref:Uncharacterized protein n=1 Tax=Papaver somniferum TaxID=3469 RepID=A0A4Y7JD34_PAPSO|nr:hypothetical protein C5167_006325 [Papaver somniferum]